jgi:hypothetical protein
MSPERVLANHVPGRVDFGLEDMQRRQWEQRQRRRTDDYARGQHRVRHIAVSVVAPFVPDIELSAR